jgi:hypothetical protein
MPSRFESLSMVALEAWGLGRPVLANGRCDVLRGQTIRSRAGLYYENFAEFAEALFTITSNRPLNQAFGENGRRFYERHYAWPVIQRKYEDMLAQLARSTAAPAPIDGLPGWLARRRRTLPPAREVVDALPKGPVSYDEPPASAEVAAVRRGPSEAPVPRPSPSTGRQAIRRPGHNRRGPQGQRPDRPRDARPGGPNGGHAGNANAPASARPPADKPPQGGNAPKGGQDPRNRDRQRRPQNRRHRRPPRRNG